MDRTWGLLVLAVVLSFGVLCQSEINNKGRRTGRWQREERRKRELAAPPIEKSGIGQFNVRDFGAVGDGVHNDTQAFVDAFSNCTRASIVVYAEVYVPDGKYLLYPLTLHHCKDCIFRIHGTIIGPRNPQDWGDAASLITIELAENLTIIGDGKGVVNGRARHQDTSVTLSNQTEDLSSFQLWSKRSWSNDFGMSEPIPLHFNGPALLQFTSVESEIKVDYMYGSIGHISLHDAPGVHVLVDGQPRWQDIELEHVHIHTSSENTSTMTNDDPSPIAVHGVVGTNSSISLSSCVIRTSGDNIFMHDPLDHTTFMYIDMFDSTVIGGNSGLTFVMQDGFFGNMSIYSNTFRETKFAVRILGTQLGRGHLEGFFFTESVMHNVGTPFLVDTFWCPAGMSCHNSSTGGVLLDFISFSAVNGTQTSGVAGMFQCDAIHECGISLDQIKIKSASGRHGENKFECWNAQGTAYDVYPDSCLTNPGS